MFRKADLFWLSLVAFSGVSLFHTSYRVQGLKEEKSNLERQIASEQEGIQVLKAEWSFLNDPVRLEQLAATYLPLKPIVATQIAGFDALPIRPSTILASQNAMAPAATPAVAATTAAAGSARSTGAVTQPAKPRDKAPAAQSQPHASPSVNATLASVQAPGAAQVRKASSKPGLLRPGVTPTLGVTRVSARLAPAYSPSKDEIGGLLSRLGRIQ